MHGLGPSEGVSERSLVALAQLDAWVGARIDVAIRVSIEPVAWALEAEAAGIVAQKARAGEVVLGEKHLR